MAILWGLPGAAEAKDDAAYCERVRADAASDAALLLGPSLHLQALRIPTHSAVDPAELFGSDSEYQLRASASWSLANAYAGLLTLRVAEADCERHAVQAALAEVLHIGNDQGAEPALREALAFLDGQRELVERIEAQAETRHARNLTNVMDLDQVQVLALQVEQKRLEIARQIVLLEEGTPGDPPVQLAELIAGYERATDRFEASASDLRSVRQWDLSFRAGVIPASEPDYFGTVELTWNLGGFFHAGAERRYLAARNAEIRNARHELPSQARRVGEQLARSDELLRQELALRERELQLLERQMNLFERSESPGTNQALAVAELRRLLLQVDMIYARALLAQRHAMAGLDGGGEVDFE